MAQESGKRNSLLFSNGKDLVPVTACVQSIAICVVNCDS